MTTRTDAPSRTLPEVRDEEASSSKKTRIVVIVQLVVTLLAFAYLFHITDVAKLTRAFREEPVWSIPTATVLLLAVMFAGTLRWSLLLRAYGAQTPPSILYLFRLQLIGLFYNMMPGAVGGDVLRGVVSRRAFGPDGMSAGLAVVLIERVFGLLALMLLVAGVLLVHPITKLQLPAWVFALGFLASIGAVVAIAIGRWLAPHLPAVLARRASTLPALTRPAMFALAMVMSVINQSLVGLMGHAAVSPLAPDVALTDSLVLAPLSFVAVFVPITVAGAGARDGAMIALYGLVGVAKEKALSASLEILLVYFIVAAIGGMLSFVTPLRSVKAP
jgi:uncharacterized membrane protein YbhN (UPF0104 family)